MKFTMGGKSVRAYEQTMVDLSKFERLAGSWFCMADLRLWASRC